LLTRLSLFGSPNPEYLSFNESVAGLHDPGHSINIQNHSFFIPLKHSNPKVVEEEGRERDTSDTGRSN
jgi:hypothetical protein